MTYCALWLPSLLFVTLRDVRFCQLPIRQHSAPFQDFCAVLRPGYETRKDKNVSRADVAMQEPVLDVHLMMGYWTRL